MLNKIHISFISLSLIVCSFFYSQKTIAMEGIIVTADHGTCIYYGQNQTHYLYWCQDETLIQIEKSNNNNPGGGNNSPGWGNE